VGSKVEATALTYDGTTYRLPADLAADLRSRGVIVPDEDLPGQFRLDTRHVIDEIEPLLTPIERSSGDSARGAGQVEGRRRLAAARFAHRHGPGGA
jgi:hypothetical protein